jgi:predicted permease
MQPQVMPAAENWLDRPINIVNWLRIVARLRPGVNLRLALNGTGVIYQRIMNEEATKVDANWAGSWRDERLVLAPGSRGLSDLRQQFSLPLFILMVVAALVLLIGCTNVANLLLARATARQKEIAVRLALGAGRWRLIRQLLVESVMLSMLGGACGLILAFWCSNALVNFISIGRSAIVLNLDPDLRILLFTALSSLLTGLLFGLIPAMCASRLDLTPALKSRGGTLSDRSRHLPMGKILVVFQVALSLVLLIGASLFLRSLISLNSKDASFNRDNVLVVRIEPKGSDQKRGANAIQLNNIYRNLQEQVEAIPGVISASLAGASPTASIQVNGGIRTTSGDLVSFGKLPVYPGYFKTLGMPILAGRDFSPTDMIENSPNVAVISATFARSAFPNEDPVGKQFECEGASSPPCDVIGVVQDSRYGNLRGNPVGTVYQPFLQRKTGRGQMFLHVRVSENNAGITERVRQEVQAIDKTLPAFQIQTLAAELDGALVQERLVATLSSIFGLLALVLAAIGLYGIMAYAVALRSNEIGIRLALGAQCGDIVGMILREAFLLALLGVAIGVPVAMAAIHLAHSLISGLLSGLQVTDPLAVFLSVVLLISVALLAGYLPARRASRVDPLTALRNE